MASQLLLNLLRLRTNALSDLGRYRTASRKGISYGLHVVPYIWGKSGGGFCGIHSAICPASVFPVNAANRTLAGIAQHNARSS